jgi:hypothetical protein
MISQSRRLKLVNAVYFVIEIARYKLDVSLMR